MKSTQGPFKRQRLTLFLFFLVIFGPFVFATILYYKGQSQKFRLTNHGDLITPAVSINETPLLDLVKKAPIKGVTLQGKWWLVYVGPQNCQAEHDIHFYHLRQIRTALGKDTPRLERLFISLASSDASQCESMIQAKYPDLARAQIQDADYDNLLGPYSNSNLRQAQGELYVIDPRGNIMMHYDPDTEPRDMLKDVKRLLRLSKIG